MRDPQLPYMSEAARSNYIEVDSPPWPQGYSYPDASNLRNVHALIIRTFEGCDVFSTSDHNLLKHDVAEILGLGTDVLRNYSARAYRFNQWGIRIFTSVVAGITSMESSEAQAISDMDTWATGVDAPDIFQLQVRNAFIDFMDQGDVSRAEAQRIIDAVDGRITVAQASGISQILTDVKAKLNGFITKRNTLFTGAATALKNGQDPNITMTATASIHLDAVESRSRPSSSCGPCASSPRPRTASAGSGSSS